MAKFQNNVAKVLLWKKNLKIILLKFRKFRNFKMILIFL